VHNASVSNRPHKHAFQNGAERGVAKIECRSPRCISKAVVHLNLDTGDRSSSSCTRRQSNAPPLLLRSSVPALSLCVSAPPLLRVMAIARRSSRACAPPWVGGGALGRARGIGRRSSRVPPWVGGRTLGRRHGSDAMRTRSTRDA
jgi:hypothetical protein